MSTKQIVQQYAKEFVSQGWCWVWTNQNKSLYSDSITLWHPKMKDSKMEIMVEDILSGQAMETML